VKLKNVRTFKADDLFPLEYRIWASGVGKEKLPIKNDEESSLVDKSIEISNLRLLIDLAKIIRLNDELPDSSNVQHKS